MKEIESYFIGTYFISLIFKCYGKIVSLTIQPKIIWDNSHAPSRFIIGNRNWLTWLERPRSPKIGHLQVGDLGKLVVSFGLQVSLRTRGVDNISRSESKGLITRSASVREQERTDALA